MVYAENDIKFDVVEQFWEWICNQLSVKHIFTQLSKRLLPSVI